MSPVLTGIASEGQWGIPGGGFDTVLGLGQYVRKTVVFDSGVGTGAVGKVPLFDVVGAIAYRLIAICEASLASGAGATISVGVDGGAAAGIIAVTTAVDLDAGEIWYDATPTTKQDTWANSIIEQIIGDGADIEADVLVNPITSGTLTFAVFWAPITEGASLVPTPD